MKTSTGVQNSGGKKKFVKALMALTLVSGISYIPVVGYLVFDSPSVPEPQTGRVHSAPVKWGPAYVTKGQVLLIKGLGLGTIVLGIVAVVLNSKWKTKCL
jgi:hypothetical protein